MSDFDYEAIPPGYYDHVYRTNRGVQSAWHHIKFDHVNQFIDRDAVHIDLGCGPGTFVGNYLSGKCNAVGYDLSTTQIEYAKNTYPNCFFEVVGDFLPTQALSIDSVSLIEVIEHLNPSQINGLLAEIIRVLKEEGRLIVTTPNYSSCWPVIEWMVNRISKVSYEDQHISKFNKHKLCEVLSEHGFQIQCVTTSNLIAPFVAVFGNGFINLALKLEKYFQFIPGSIICVVAIKNAKK